MTKKKTNIDSILSELSKISKDGLYKGGDLERRDKTPTGSLILDKALEGGFIKGKIIECYGKESTGKTALALCFLTNATEPMGFIDGESAYDKQTANMYGVDTSNLIVQRPPFIEAGMEMTLQMIQAGVKYIIFDSIAGIPTKSEVEGNMEDHNVGKKAFRMGQLMRKLHLRADESGATIFFINQIRDSMQMYGPAYTTPGGHALLFHASYRLYVTSTTKITEGDMTIGHYMNIKIVKNKFGQPNIKLAVPLIYGVGISPEWEILDLALQEKILQKSGAWIKYDETTVGQGKVNAFNFLLDNPEFTKELIKKIQL